MSLVQLKNGDWIDPSIIMSIRVLDTSDAFGGGFHPPRLTVGCSDNMVIVVEYPTLEAACAARDELGVTVNRLCNPESES